MTFVCLQNPKNRETSCWYIAVILQKITQKRRENVKQEGRARRTISKEDKTTVKIIIYNGCTDQKFSVAH